MASVSVYCSLPSKSQFYIGSSLIGLAFPFLSSVYRYAPAKMGCNSKKPQIGLAPHLVFEVLVTLQFVWWAISYGDLVSNSVGGLVWATCGRFGEQP